MEQETNYIEEVGLGDKQPKQPKKFLWIAIIIIVLGAGIGAYFYSQKSAQAPVVTNENKVVFREEKPALTDDRKKVLEAEAEGAKAQLNSLTGANFAEDRDKLNTKLAGIEIQLQRYQSGLDYLEKVSSGYQDKTARVWAYYIMAYRGMNDSEKGLTATNKALSLDSTNPDYLLSQIEFSVGKSTDEYKAMYDSAIKASEDDVEVIVSYARYLESVGDKAGAIAEWQRAGEVHASGKATYDSEIARLNQQ